MKKLSQFINESLVENDIEDNLVYFTDLGFTIDTYDDIGGQKGRKSTLFVAEDWADGLGQPYGFQPSPDGSYVMHYIVLKKSIKQFTDCDIYGKVIPICELVKRRLTNCDVYYSIEVNSSNIKARNCDTELNITFIIIDKSNFVTKELGDMLTSSRLDIYKYLNNIPDSKVKSGLMNSKSFEYKGSSLIAKFFIPIEVYREQLEDIKKHFNSICNLFSDDVKYKLKINNYTKAFMNVDYQVYTLEIFPL